MNCFYIELIVYILFVLQRRERTDAQDVEIISQDRGGVLYVLNRSAAHDGFVFKLQGPASWPTLNTIASIPRLAAAN